MSGKVLAVSVSGGIIAHILLAAVYAGQKFGMYAATGVLAIDVIVIIYASPHWLDWEQTLEANYSERASCGCGLEPSVRRSTRTLRSDLGCRRATQPVESRRGSGGFARRKESLVGARSLNVSQQWMAPLALLSS